MAGGWISPSPFFQLPLPLEYSWKTTNPDDPEDPRLYSDYRRAGAHDLPYLLLLSGDSQALLVAPGTGRGRRRPGRRSEAVLLTKG